MAEICGRGVAVDRRDPNERRVTHRGDGEVVQRIVIGPLALDGGEAESLGGKTTIEAVGPGAPDATEILMLVEIEAERRIGRAQLQGGEPP